MADKVINHVVERKFDVNELERWAALVQRVADGEFPKRVLSGVPSQYWGPLGIRKEWFE